MTGARKKSRRKKNRGELRSEATLQSLQDAAMYLFAKKGLDTTTIDDITEKADVGKGTFYYYYKNKNELVEDLMGRMLADLRSTLVSRCAESNDLEMVLDCLISTHIDFFSQRWEDFVLYFQGKSDLTLKEGYEGLDKQYNDYLEHISHILDAVIKYQLNKDILIRIACAVAGFVSGYYSFAVISMEEDKLEETLKPVRGALVKGLSRFIRESVPVENSSMRW